MTPSLSVPTDNIYKFASLFGLALIVVAAISYMSAYTAALNSNVQYAQAVIAIESKEERTKLEERMLEFNNRLIEVSVSNRSMVTNVMAVVFAIGCFASAWGFTGWVKKIQARDDEVANLQLRKLRAEVEAIEAKRSPSGGAEAAMQPPHE